MQYVNICQLPFVSLYQFYVTALRNCHKLSGLIQHTFIVFVSVYQESGHNLSESSALLLTRSCGWQTKSYIFCWLLARGLPQFPEASSVPYHDMFPSMAISFLTAIPGKENISGRMNTKSYVTYSYILMNYISSPFPYSIAQKQVTGFTYTLGEEIRQRHAHQGSENHRVIEWQEKPG